MEKKSNGWKYFAIFLLGTIIGLFASPGLKGISIKSICGNQIAPDKFDDICEDDTCDCQDCELPQ